MQHSYQSGGITDGTNLTTTHNAGFFSCSNLRMCDIIHFMNEYHTTPKHIDSRYQYFHYKNDMNDDIASMCFKTSNDKIDWTGLDITPLWGGIPEQQFDSYKNIDPRYYSFVDKYFSMSLEVSLIYDFFIKKYKIDLNNTCAVFYRGNDKNRETQISPYAEFIYQCLKIKDNNPGIKFFVQPDETEFLETMILNFGNDVIFLEETPHIRKADTCMMYVLDKSLKPQFAMNFLAAVNIMANSKYLITHSGNCGMWTVLYRKNNNNVIQYLNGQWIS